MAADIPTLSRLLQASLDPTQHKQAEAAITQEEAKPRFSLSLLQIVADESQSPTVRLASALYFKNFIRRHWVDEDGNHKLPNDEVVAIKSELIGLMIAVPPNLQAQLGEAISAIANSDFWERWDTLIDDLASRLTPDNTTVNNGVLRVAHSIFKRWRPLFRSDALFTEILHVIAKFAGPFLAQLQHTHTLISNTKDPNTLKAAFTTLDLLVKIFYDLSCQDLPEPFEENIGPIFELLHSYLKYDNATLHTDDESEAGPLEHVKAGIFEVLIIYVQKYEDAFGPHLGPHIQTTWTFLTSIGLETKYDIVVSKALQFLTAVAGTSHVENFNNEQVLVEVIEKVILPNLTLRESDVELFEDEPIEFIRRDLEGSDSDTRRRAATNFLRQLMSKYEALVTSTSQTYVDRLLAEYSSNKSNWKAKDTAIYLFSAIAATGNITTTQGVLTTNPNVNVLGFLQANIAADLQAREAEPILKVDAIKFIYVFRSQLSPDLWRTAFPLLVNSLANDNYVIHTYAAIAVERALAMTDGNRQPIIPSQDVHSSSNELLTHLFKLVTRNPAPEKVQENEFLMKCIMRVLIFIREGVQSISEAMLTNFINILKVIRHNPSNPRFQYYLFEGLGALVRFAAPTHGAAFETKLYEPFAAILAQGVEEFTPYVFQIFAALLEANPSGELNDLYKGLFDVIIRPDVWNQRGNIPALVRLLTSMMPRDVQNIVANNRLEPILGIFQKLISSKANEIQAFDLIEALVTYIPLAPLQQYFVTIVQLMLTRLSNMKTEGFQQRFIAFYHLVSAKQDKGLGADFFIKTCDEVQHDVFKPIYLTIILPDTQKLSRPIDRKTAVVSFTKTLTDSQAFIDRYPKGWNLTTQRLLDLLINPPVPSAADDIIPDADVDETSFGVGFTQLNTCRKAQKDPFPEITDVKVWVGQWLKEGNTRLNGRVATLVKDRLDPAVQQALAGYLQ